MVDRILKIMLGLIGVLLFLLFLPTIHEKFFDNAQKKVDDRHVFIANAREGQHAIATIKEVDHWVNDSVYIWDEQQVNWLATGLYTENQTLNPTHSSNETSLAEPVHVKWETLMDIRYRLRYFSQIQADMFSPVFGEKIKALNNKEVIVEGFVIPFDEEGELLALSYNPYSSCFFCGNASPASVISMYMDNAEARYQLDDFKKFRGNLFLNQNDPNQFYYVLKNVTTL